MSMMKNLFSFIAILCLLDKANAVGFWNMNIAAAAAKAEAEVLKCFEILKAGSTYTVSEHGVITDIPVKVYDSEHAVKFELTHIALAYINTQILGGGLNNDKELWERASKSYQLYLAGKGNATPVAYHNICHGLHVMLYSMIFAESAFEAPNSQLRTLYAHNNDGEVDRYTAALGFAGLFHDAAHNGIGNTYHKQVIVSDEVDVADVNKSDDVHDTLITSFPLNFDKGGVVLSEIYKGYNYIETELPRIKPNNQGAGFTWEDIHATLAIGFFRSFAGDGDAHGLEAFIRQSILNTNMALHLPSFPDRIANKLVELAADMGTAAGLAAIYGATYLTDAYINPLHIVHGMDIGLNASSNLNLVFHQIGEVNQEFRNELNLLGDIDMTQEDFRASGPYTAFCKDFVDTFKRAQWGFTAFVIKPTIVQGTIPHAEDFPAVTGTLNFRIIQENRKDDTDDALVQRMRDALTLVGTVTAAVPNMNTVANDPYLKYLDKSVSANIGIFSQNDCLEGDMPYTGDEAAAACGRHRRMIRLIV